MSYYKLLLVIGWTFPTEIQVKNDPDARESWLSPFSSDPLHHFNARKHTGSPLPHLAVLVELVFAGQRLESDNAENPKAILD